MTRTHHDFGTAQHPDSRQIQRNIRIDQQEFLHRQVGNLTAARAPARPSQPAGTPERR